MSKDVFLTRLKGAYKQVMKLTHPDLFQFQEQCKTQNEHFLQWMHQAMNVLTSGQSHSEEGRKLSMVSVSFYKKGHQEACLVGPPKPALDNETVHLLDRLRQVLGHCQVDSTFLVEAIQRVHRERPHQGSPVLGRSPPPYLMMLRKDLSQRDTYRTVQTRARRAAR